MWKVACTFLLCLFSCDVVWALTADDRVHLHARLDSPDVAVRKPASAELLQHLQNSPQPLGFLSDLERLLSDKYWHVRMNAAEGLAACGERSLPVLRRALDSGDYVRTKWAAVACQRMGTDAGPMGSLLCRVLEHAGLLSTTRTTLAALAAIGPAYPEMIQLLRQPKRSWLTHRHYFQAIGHLGQDGHTALFILLNQRHDPKALLALQKVIPPKFLDMLRWDGLRADAGEARRKICTAASCSDGPTSCRTGYA